MPRFAQRLPKPRLPSRSLFGLNAANFFLAELSGVVGPFISVFLKGQGWHYAAVGIAAGMGGLGTLILQGPAGYFCDRITFRRILLGITSLIMGIGFGLLPIFPKFPYLEYFLLFCTGAASAFFVPLLASLALTLGGHRSFAYVTGQNQSWNHAGNIAAALLGLLILRTLGLTAVFYLMACSSFFAIFALLLVGKTRKQDERKNPNQVSLAVLKKPQVLLFLVSMLFYHVSNQPGLGLVSLYMKQLGGKDDLVAVAVLIAQAAMIPTAILTGKYAEKIGRKPVFLIAYIGLPLRFFLYPLFTSTAPILAIQILDGISAGIYGVIIALVCDDFTRKDGGFGSLLGLAQATLALGAFLGPVLQGFATQLLGFRSSFLLLAAFGVVGSLIFAFAVRETKDGGETRTPVPA